MLVWVYIKLVFLSLVYSQRSVHYKVPHITDQYFTFSSYMYILIILVIVNNSIFYINIC